MGLFNLLTHQNNKEIIFFNPFKYKSKIKKINVKISMERAMEKHW